MGEELVKLVPFFVGATLIVLFVGIFAMFRGGSFNRSYSNKLMRLRVLLQFLTIVVAMAALYLTGK